MAALESWDREIIGPLLEALPRFGAHRILLMPDHATPIRLGTHTSDPVPYLLFDSEVETTGCAYTETATAGLPARRRASPDGSPDHLASHPSSGLGPPPM